MTPLPPDDPRNDSEEADPASTDFARALEEFERSRPSAAASSGAAREITVGMKLKGRVVSLGEESILVDYGGRSEAVTETQHFRAADGTISVRLGDQLDLFVLEAGDQVVLGPSFRADAHAAMQHVREAQAAGIPVTGKVTGRNAGGLEVELGGARGFCPLSQVDTSFCEDPSIYIGRTLEFLVTQVGDVRGGVVLSRRALLRRAEEEAATKLLATIQPGQEMDGTVARLEPFGAFVNIGGVDGMVHVSEVSHERVAHPRDVLQVGQRVRVRVLRIELGKDNRPRIALSIKATAPDPWSGIEQRFAPGACVSGTVARLADFGAFVTLAPGVDGLVHISEAALHRVADVREVLSVGQQVEAVVTALDLGRKRISLSIREALAGTLPPPREPQVGEEVEGRVGNIKPFGVFVDLPQFGARVSGLIPREETGEKRGADLTRSFAIGEVVRVQILEVNAGKIRLALASGDQPAQPERAVDLSSPGAAAPGAPMGAGQPGGSASGREAELTPMALAMRKAMEEAEKKKN